MKHIVKHILTAALILAAIPAQAGGPVLTEDAYEAEPQHDRKIGGLVVGLIIIGALLAASNGGPCHGDTPEPSPEPGPC